MQTGWKCTWQVEKLTKKIKKQISWCRGQIYILFNSNFSSTNEARGNWGMEWKLWQDGNKEAGGKGFLNQSPCHDCYRASFCAMTLALDYHPQYQIFRSNTGLCTWAPSNDHRNLSTMKAVCSLPLWAQTHQPSSHWALTAFLLSRRQATSQPGLSTAKHLYRLFRD